MNTPIYDSLSSREKKAVLQKLPVFVTVTEIPPTQLALNNIIEQVAKQVRDDNEVYEDENVIRLRPGKMSIVKEKQHDGVMGICIKHNDKLLELFSNVEGTKHKVISFIDFLEKSASKIKEWTKDWVN